MEKLNEYLTYVIQEKAVLFLGAGISQIAGCKVWADVRDDLLECDYVKERVKKNELDPSISIPAIIEYVERISTDQYKFEYQKILRSAVRYDLNKLQQDYFPLINKLRQIKPHPKIVTTNIDQCLELSDSFKNFNIIHELNDLTKSNFSGYEAIFHIHGYHERLDQALWPLSRYAERYDNSTFRDFLNMMFSTYSVLFLGCSFNDPDITRILSTSKMKDLMHFALIPSSSELATDSSKELYARTFNVSLIDYGDMKDFISVISAWIDNHFPPVLSIESDNEQPDKIETPK